MTGPIPQREKISESSGLVEAAFLLLFFLLLQLCNIALLFMQQTFQEGGLFLLVCVLIPLYLILFFQTSKCKTSTVRRIHYVFGASAAFLSCLTAFIYYDYTGGFLEASGSVLMAILCPLVFVAMIAAIVVFPFYVLYQSWNSIQGARLQRHLHGRGYAWVTLQDARKLYASIGRRAFQLPEFEQLASLPGYVDGDVLTMAKFSAFLPER